MSALGSIYLDLPRRAPLFYHVQVMLNTANRRIGERGLRRNGTIVREHV
jgi:hypothetical protein